MWRFLSNILGLWKFGLFPKGFCLADKKHRIGSHSVFFIVTDFADCEVKRACGPHLVHLRIIVKLLDSIVSFFQFFWFLWGVINGNCPSLYVPHAYNFMSFLEGLDPLFLHLNVATGAHQYAEYSKGERREDHCDLKN